ncbi:MAG TPA: glycosyltransferase [Alphaproteobacteria bacterium]|nr:glycosyltransferase [Alphaproteobacteria bacterium]
MNSLARARIAVTLPPEKWFGGYDRRAAEILIEQLEHRFGLAFHRVDTKPFAGGDLAGQLDLVDEVRAYQPDLAISLSNAGYGLMCALKATGANIFTDILGVPLLLLWDHGLFQFPSIILSESPSEESDAIRRVRERISRPLMFHSAIDSGQVDEMRRIGLLATDNVSVVAAAAYKPYLNYGENDGDYLNDIAFAGNVYLSDRHARAFPKAPIAGRCYDAVLSAKRTMPLAVAWNLLTEQIQKLSEAERHESRLDFDQAYFWEFANQLIGAQCNTQARTEVLNSIDRRVSFYGAFADPEGIPRLGERMQHVDYKGSVDFADGLPEVYARSKILVDITNAAFITNCSSKPICCFAAGGFALFDFKPDAVSLLGPESEKVMYRDMADLNSKIDYFLSHDRERRDLAAHIRGIVRTKCDYIEQVHAAADRILSR